MENWQFERHLKRLALAPTLLALLVACALSFQIYRQRQVAAKVDRADREISAANHLQKLLIDMETGFRGYLLSGKIEFLEPYERAAARIEQELLRLKEDSVHRIPQVPEQYEALRASMVTWLAYARKEILETNRSRAPGTPFIDSEGKQRMDAMRAQITAILAQEESHRDALRREWEREFYFSVSATFLLCLLAALASAYIARRESDQLVEQYNRMLEEIRQQGEQYRAIFQGVKDYGIALLDTEGRVEAWSPGAEALTGLRPGEITGKSIRALGATEEELKTNLELAARHGRYESEGWRQRKDGSRFWADVVTTALFGSGGGLRGFSAIIRDFSKRHQLEEERAFLIRKLEEGVKSRDDFLVLASHELKTPLTSVQMQLQLIERKAKKEGHPDGTFPVRAATLTLLQRQVKRLSRLVEAMLDISRLHSGGLPVEFAEVNLSGLVTQAVEDHQQHSRDLGCPIEARVEAGLLVRGDAFRLEQVIVNLIGNAFKYGCAGPIEIALKKQGPTAKFTISDRGPGIPEEFREKIFERFARARKSGDQGGLGLGLYIAKEYVEAQGGTIRLENGPGEGARFVFELPLLQAA
jgi:PAS domain S-box-containing protein